MKTQHKPKNKQTKKRNESLTPIKEVELTHNDRKEISGPCGQAVGRYGREGSQTGRRKFLLKVMDMFTTLIVVTVSWVDTYTKMSNNTFEIHAIMSIIPQ